MARLASVEKAGYYPLPTTVAERLLQHFEISQYVSRNMTWLDPCCGEGAALKMLTSPLIPGQFHTLGIELDIQRAGAAQSVLEHVVQADMGRVSILDDSDTPVTVDVLYLNPPYDTAPGNRRLEALFVESTVRWLRESGTLLLVIPDYVLEHPHMAQTLQEKRLQIDWVIRFPDPEYAVFKQVIVVAHKVTHAVTEYNRGIVQLEDQFKFRLSSANTYGTRYFRFEVLPDLESVSLLENQDRSLYTLIGDPTLTGDPVRPLIAMRGEHVALAAAGGLLNGLEADGKLIRGSNKLTVQTTEIERDGGVKEIVEAHVLVHSLTSLDLANGTFTTVSSDGDQYSDILLAHAETFLHETRKRYPPLVTDEVAALYEPALRKVPPPQKLTRNGHSGLLDPQLRVAASLLHGWKIGTKVLTLVGEMSVGKTYVTLAAMRVLLQATNKKLLVMVPPQRSLIRKWIREASAITGVQVMEIRSITDAQALFEMPGFAVGVLPETMAKASSPVQNIELGHVYAYKMAGSIPSQLERDKQEGWKIHPRNPYILARFDGFECPHCMKSMPSHWFGGGSKLNQCLHCGEQLYSFQRRKSASGNDVKAAYPIARYVRRHYARQYALIVDEAHLTKGHDTNIGISTQDLLAGCFRAVQMTGTLFSGMPSSLFHLMYRADPSFRKLYPYTGVQEFVNRYGLFKRITRRYPEWNGNRVSGYKEVQGNWSERPGMHPAMVSVLLPSCVFLTLDQFDLHMPDYSEHTLFVDPPDELLRPYQAWLLSAKGAAVSLMMEGERKALSQWQHARYRILDRPGEPDECSALPGYAWAGVARPAGMEMWPKEEALVRLLLQEKAAGRGVLVFVAQTHRGDVYPRLSSLCSNHGIQTVNMRETEKDRVSFIEQAFKDGCDALFTSAPLVAVGIDILQTPTIVWFGREFNTYLVPQANRRSYRLTQEKDVKIYYLAYNRTCQADAFERIAKKMGAAQSLQGNVVSGLAALLGDPDLVVQQLQEVATDSQHFESDITMEMLPPLPSQEPAVPEPVIQNELPFVVYLPRRLATKWGKNGHDVERRGICVNCMLPFDDKEWAKRRLRVHQGSLFVVHSECSTKEDMMVKES